MSFKYVILWCIIFYLGIINTQLRVKNTDDLLPKAPINAVVTGRVVSIPNSSDERKTKFFLAVDSVNGDKVKAKTFVTLHDETSDFSDLKIGNKYKIEGKLRTPFRATNPSQFDYGRYLRNFNTFTVFYANKSDCELYSDEIPLKWRFLQSLNEIRNNILEKHEKYLKSPNLEILGGIVFGDDAVAPPDYIKSSFSNSGLLHILAASGMNVAFIFGFWFYILSRFKVPYRFRVISGMGIVVLYTLMTGLGPSVIRASLMLLFVLAGKLIDRDSHSIALLSFVAFLMLVYNPAFINDVGFQLSFLVTFGIICTANVLISKFKGHKIKEFIAGALLIPIVAQIWVIPIQMFYFNTISTYSFFANVSIMPFLSVISFGGFVSSVLAIISPIADFVCRIFDFVLNYFLNVLVNISDFFSSLPNSLIEAPHPSVLQIFIYYMIVLLITLMIKEGFTKRHVGLVALLVLILFSTTVKFHNTKLEILVFDVGNAESFLVKTPKNKYILIDTAKASYKGGKPQSEYIIRKYLKDRGIKSLEFMLITHFDTDHAGGAKNLLERLEINRVYLNSKSDLSRTAQEIYNSAKERETNIIVPKDKEIIYSEPNLEMRTFIEKTENENENSVIMLVRYNDFEMLFTGDSGAVSLNRISKNLPAKLEVLKVGHHGAENVVDKNILSLINPSVSVISTGYNSYGHPSLNTLRLLKDTQIYRTDKNHSIKISTDGDKYEISTFNTQKKKFEVTFEDNAE